MENVTKNIRRCENPPSHDEHRTNKTAPISTLQLRHSKRNFAALNSRGFAFALGLSLLPLVIGAFSAASGLFIYVYKKNELLYQCESALLKAQEILLEGEEKILQLNPQIEQLVIEKRILKQALAVAPTPIERVAIRAELTRIEIMLYNLKFRQYFFKNSSENMAQLVMLNVERSLLQKLRQFSKDWKASLHAQVFKNAPAMKIVEKKIDPSAKIYLVPPQMSSLQTLTLRWSLQGTSLFPRWLTYLHSQRFFWQDSCSTYPQAKELRWHAEIAAAAHL